MEILKNYIDEQLYVEVSGDIVHKGILVKTGTDIIVLYNGMDFLYIPMIHLQKIYKKEDDSPDVTPYDRMQDEYLTATLSFRKVLNHARGLFSEIHIATNQSIHGYVVSVMNNYLVFYSPIYKTVYLSLHHLKWFIPYIDQKSPYALSKEELPIHPFNLPLARSFEEQLKKLLNQMVVLDLGQDHQKIGQLKTIENNIAELITARQTSSFVNIRHIKTIHLPV